MKPLYRIVRISIIIFSWRYIMDNPYKIGIIGGTGKVGRHIAANAIQ